MKKKEFRIDGIPAVLYGENSEKIYIFVHGRYSRKEEAHFFAETAAESGYQVLSFDLPEHGEREGSQYKCTAVNGVHDLGIIYSFIRERYRSISLYACSLGAFFSLTAYRNIILDNCLFVSPILDMERIIRTMMQWADVSEDELKDKGEIDTSFGEKLSWDYYQYVRKNPVEKWNTKTHILYGGNDSLTERCVLDSFSARFNCITDIMEGGEHYFHTPEQLEYLEKWIRKFV